MLPIQRNGGGNDTNVVSKDTESHGPASKTDAYVVNSKAAILPISEIVASEERVSENSEHKRPGPLDASGEDTTPCTENNNRSEEMILAMAKTTPADTSIVDESHTGQIGAHLPATEERVSKKRPREESMATAAELPSKGTSDKIIAEISGEQGSPTGNIGADVGRRAGCKHEDTNGVPSKITKIVDDGRKDEVVSQDLVTGDIKRRQISETEKFVNASLKQKSDSCTNVTCGTLELPHAQQAEGGTENEVMIGPYPRAEDEQHLTNGDARTKATGNAISGNGDKGTHANEAAPIGLDGDRPESDTSATVQSVEKPQQELSSSYQAATMKTVDPPVHLLEGSAEEKVDSNASEMKRPKLDTRKGSALEESSAASTGRDCPEHALPVARTFFDFRSISTFETRLLPEFFTGSSTFKTPEMYIQSRNYMVRTYKQMLEKQRTGDVYLSGTECRRKLAGDACATLRIHDFLDRFGLINTRAKGRRPRPFPFSPPPVHLWNVKMSDASNSASGKGTSNRGGKVRSRLTEMIDRSKADTATERIDTNMTRMPSRDWDRAEVRNLLEAAVAHPQDWDAVADQVGSGRSPIECMQQFLGVAVEKVLVEDSSEREVETTPQDSIPGHGKAALPTQSPASRDRVAEGKIDATPSDGIHLQGGSLRAGKVDTLPKSDGPEEMGNKPAEASITGVFPRYADATDASTEVGSGAPVADTTKKVSGPTDVNETIPDPPYSSVEDSRHSHDLGVARTEEQRRKVRSPVWASGATGQARSGQVKRQPPRRALTPTLALASALVSNVHPEILQAAMEAATSAADGLMTQQRDQGECSGDETASKWASGGAESGVEGRTGKREPIVSGGEDVAMNDTQSEQMRLGETTSESSAVPNGGACSPRAAGATDSTAMRLDLNASAGQPQYSEADGSDQGIPRTSVPDNLWVEREAARLEAGRAAVLSAASLQARALAKMEDRRTEQLVADLLEARVRRLEMRLQCFDELDQALESERKCVEHDRAQMMTDQARASLSR